MPHRNGLGRALRQASRHDFSFVVPCYNEAGNIPELVNRLANVQKQCRGLEIIFVNNGSQDATGQALAKSLGLLQNSKVVTLEINQGYGGGIKAGLEEASGVNLGWIHADLQIPPESIVACISKAREIDRPYFLKGLRKGRRAWDKIFTAAMSVFESFLFGTRLNDVNGQPTLFSRDLLPRVLEGPDDFSLDLHSYVSAKKFSLRIERIKVSFDERKWGSSSWNTSIRSKVMFIFRTLRFSLRLRGEQ